MGDLTGIDRLTAVLTVADGRARSLLLTVGPEDAPVLTAVMDFTAKVTGAPGAGGGDRRHRRRYGAGEYRAARG